MAFEFKVGDRLEFLEKMEDEGHVIPELQNQPELFQDAFPYLSAFHALSSSRQMGFGIGYIPYSEIHAYLNEQQIYNPDERIEYFKWIKFIDQLYVVHNNQKK